MVTAYNIVDTPHGEKMAPRFRAAKTLHERYGTDIIGLPDSAMVITNSDRSSWICPRQGYYSHVVGLRSKPNAAMRFGSAFDNAMGMLFEFYANGRRFRGDNDRIADLTHAGVHELLAEQREKAVSEEDYQRILDDSEELNLSVYNALRGWIEEYENDFCEQWDVVGTQVKLAAPVVSGDKVFKSKVPVVQGADAHGNVTWRLARAGDEQHRLVTLPWFQICKLDALVQHKKTGQIVVWETKTSKTPEAYSRNLILDNQVPGYVRAVLYNLQEGNIVGTPSTRWVWDVTSSAKRPPPRLLKNGKYSKASNSRTPSWMWQDLLNDPDNPYASGNTDDINEMRDNAALNIDELFHYREYGSYTVDRLREYEIELLADVRKYAANLRAGASIDTVEDSAMHVANAFPRQPYCRKPGGYCSFTAVCQSDNAFSRAEYVHSEPVVWLSTKAANHQEGGDA